MSGVTDKKNKNLTPEFETLAITDSTDKVPVTNVVIPSEQAIEDAKDWVDSNQK